MPHLCFVTSEIVPGTGGGIGQLLGSVAPQLAAAGWQTTWLLEMDQPAVERFREHAARHLPRANVVAVDEVSVNAKADERIPLWAFQFSAYHRAWRVAHALRVLCGRQRFDAIEFPDYLGLGYVALKWRRLWGDEFEGIRMLVRLHGTAEWCLWADDAPRYTAERQQLIAMERYCLRHCDGWLASTPSVADRYRAHYGRPDAPVVLATPPVDRVGSGCTHRRRLGAPPHRILFYGKLQRLKGADVFVDAALLLSERADLPVVFDVVGPDVPDPWDGSSFRARLERAVPDEIRDRINFHGQVHREPLQQLTQAADIAVVPSRVEAFCLAAHELNWMGIPLVLADIPAFRDFFVDGRDCRFFDGSAEDLAKVIAEILHEPGAIAAWTWNAPDVEALDRGVEAYTEALHRCFPPPAPPGSYELPLVSVVVPYYEMHAYVEDALASVEASTYSSWEVVVVDDGSRSRSAREVLWRLAERFVHDHRYRFVCKRNGGLGSARNTGIAHARGAYVVTLDSDDLLHPDYLARGVRALERTRDLAAVSCFVSFFFDGTPSSSTVNYLVPYDLHPILVALENRVGGAVSMFRRGVFDHVRYDEILVSFEDWDLWWKVLESVGPVECLPAILYRYRVRGNSMLQTTGRFRHAHLVDSFAERHEAHLRRHAVEIFRVFSNKVATLYWDGEDTRNAQASTIHRLHAELQAIRGSRGFRWLERAWDISSQLRTRWRKPRVPRERTHQLRIEVLPDRNPSAQGHQVWFAGARATGSMAYVLPRLADTRMWAPHEVTHPVLAQSLLADSPGATLSDTVRGERFGIALLAHPWSGMIRVSVDGCETTLDLYAPEAESGFRQYRWLGDRFEPSLDLYN
jgi:glycosyltransferase involved in cell wall biosynthesis